MEGKTNAENEIIEALCKELAIDIPTTFAQNPICIYNVPPTIRAINPEAYTPRVISIGPIHNGRKWLREMEVKKLWYLQEFCKRLRKSGKGKDKDRAQVMKDLKGLIEGKIDKIRQSYPASATIKSSNEKLIWMILLDSLFILELFLRLEFKVKNDPILSTPWLKCAIQRDLVLLENQVPFFILKKLYKSAVENSDQRFPPSYFGLTLNYFTDSKYVTNETIKEGLPTQIAHFTDLVRYSWCFDHPPKAPGGDDSNNKNDINTECRNYNECRNWYSVTKLNRAGVKFRKSSPSTHLLKVEFGDRGWFREKLLPKCMKHVFSLVFEVPQLKIDDGTECIFRNLMALEQCRYPDQSYICDYVMLLDSLIDTAEDVDHLTDKRIILNMLGCDIAVKKMVNRLGLGIVQGHSSFRPVCNKLNKYYESNWNKDVAFLKSVYFKNVWIGSGTVLGVIVLLLTLANTIRLFATTRY